MCRSPSQTIRSRCLSASTLPGTLYPTPLGSGPRRVPSLERVYVKAILCVTHVEGSMLFSFSLTVFIPNHAVFIYQSHVYQPFTVTHAKDEDTKSIGYHSNHPHCRHSHGASCSSRVITHIRSGRVDASILLGRDSSCLSPSVVSVRFLLLIRDHARHSSVRPEPRTSEEKICELV